MLVVSYQVNLWKVIAPGWSICRSQREKPYPIFRFKLRLTRFLECAFSDVLLKSGCSRKRFEIQKKVSKTSAKISTRETNSSVIVFQKDLGTNFYNMIDYVYRVVVKGPFRVRH